MRLKRFIILFIVLSVGLAASACGHADIAGSATVKDANAEPATESGSLIVLEGLLHAGRVWSNGFGVYFYMRNISGHTLYYGKEFLLYKHVDYGDENWDLRLSLDSAGFGPLAPDAVRSYSVGWGKNINDTSRQISPGRYRLVIKVFSDEQDGENIEELHIEFDVFAFDEWDNSRPDWRQDFIDFAVLGKTSENMVLLGDVEVSKTGIAFSLQNRSDANYGYGRSWDLAYYENGRWRAVPYKPDAGHGWTDDMLILQSGGIQRFQENWEWSFWELPPGRYMYIRDSFSRFEGFNYSRNYEHVMVEFTIEANSPASLSTYDEPSPHVRLVEYSNVTATGITVVLENASVYDLNHYAVVGVISQSGLWLDRLPDYRSPNYGDWEWEPFPSGSRLELSLDWSLIYGVLPPGQYKIIVNSFGDAPPPHPTGSFQEVLDMSITVS